MLKEIKVQMHPDQNIYFLFNDVFYSEEEFFCECRVLIDEPDEYEEIGVTSDLVYEEENLPFQDDDGPDPVPEKPKRGGSRKSKKEDILKAWNGGERSVKEIAAIVGCSEQTVRNYIPG